MTRIHRYLAAAAVTAALIGAPTAANAAPLENAPHADAQTAARQIQGPRIVAPGEHVAEPGGAVFWLTPEGKHWTLLDDPYPQFTSVVDGNIDLGSPGVSAHTEISSDGHVLLSGVYYGGTGTAARVTIRTTAGTLHGNLLELAGDPGWGVWYVSTDSPTGSDGLSVRNIVVRDTHNHIYSRLDLN
ncbi:hypothetical protein [Streptomyces sp. NPDC048489]|uniref:hypothetical protein n=1 Tax=Streptomyces sp. NPDC048489 TaxID=3154504 RepID=UPI0034202A12